MFSNGLFVFKKSLDQQEEISDGAVLMTDGFDKSSDSEYSQLILSVFRVKTESVPKND